MVLIWVAGISIASPLSVYRTYEERQWKNLVETYCAENTEILPVYWHVLVAFLVWFPLVIMIICYSAIFWKLDRYEKKVLKREHPISVSYKKKFAKTMFIILVSFVILRLPFTALGKKAKILKIVFILSIYFISCSVCSKRKSQRVPNEWNQSVLLRFLVYSPLPNILQLFSGSVYLWSH